MKIKGLVFPLLLAIGVNASAQQKQFSWLIGTWELKDKNIFESWSPARDGKTLEGKSYRVKNADTVMMEEIRITYEAEAFHYIPDVAGDQGPVDFRITGYDVNGFVAENPAHDFPKIIRYRFRRGVNGDGIEASIEGNGKSISYALERIE